MYNVHRKYLRSYSIEIPSGALEGAKKFKKYPIKDIIPVSHDTKIFRFELPKKDMYLGLPIGQHILMKADIPITLDGKKKKVIREYTPISTYDVQGYFDLLIKIYKPTPQCPTGGLMTSHLNSLKIGDEIEISGPRGKCEYHGRGEFTINGQKEYINKLGLIAGGTGITPIYQVLKAIVSDPQDKTQVSVIYANRTIEDILLRSELQHLSLQHNFNLYFTVSALAACMRIGKEIPGCSLKTLE